MDSETTKRGPGRPKNAAPEAEANEYTVPTSGVLQETAKPQPVTMFPVTLLKNYHPRGAYEIVGEPTKPTYPGVGFKDKLWAGTTVKLPSDEARALIENKITTVERVVDDNGQVITRNGQPITERRTVKFPLAERADAIPI